MTGSLALEVLSLCAIVAVGLCVVTGRSRRSGVPVLIVGTGPLTPALIDELARAGGRRIVGVVADDRAAESRTWRCPIVGTLGDLPELLATMQPDVVVASRASWESPVMQPLLEWRARGLRVEDAVDVYARLTGKLAIETVPPSALVFSQAFRRSPVLDAAQRPVGALVAALALIAVAPLFALIALAIKIDSRGPVFFVQERVGAFGLPFPLIKFRTMIPDGVRPSEWAADNTDRVTRVGRWLRRFRLDELPQLVNVVRGDMAFVGPRPHPLSNFELFAGAIPYYSLRCAVRPGVTGWAQVRYRYANNLAEETEKARYDLYYIKHQSVWLDLRILADTVKFVLFGHREPTAAEAVAPAPAPRPVTVSVDKEAA